MMSRRIAAVAWLLVVVPGCGDRLEAGQECRAVPISTRVGSTVPVFIPMDDPDVRLEAGTRVLVEADDHKSVWLPLREGEPKADHRRIQIRVLEGRFRGLSGQVWRCCLAPIR